MSYDQVQIAANNTCHQVCILSDLFCYGPITKYKNDSVESYHLNNDSTSINYCCSAEGGHIKKYSLVKVKSNKERKEQVHVQSALSH